MNIYQLPREVQQSLEKLLKSDIQYVTIASWIVISAPNKVYKSYIVLCEDSLHMIDERFDKVFATFKYTNISRVLVDINHQQCFQIHLNYSNDHHGLNTLQQQIQRNSVIDFKSFKEPPIIFTQARLNFLNHLAMCWKTNYMINNFSVMELEVYRFDIIKLREVRDTTGDLFQNSNQSMRDTRGNQAAAPLKIKTYYMSQINVLNQLQDALPPPNDIIAVGGKDIWTLQFAKSHLIENFVFQIDKSFIRKSLNDFYHSKSKNLRIHIEVNKPMPLNYFKQMGLRCVLQAYAEQIFQNTIIKDLEDHGEINEYTILSSTSYQKRHNLSVKKKLSMTDGWIIHVRTVYRDIFLILMRESYLPPTCSCFQDYYMIIYGDHEGEYDDIQLASGIIKPYQLQTIITTIIDNSRQSHHMEQSYQDAIIQQSLDSLLFQSFEDYNYLSIKCKFIPSYMVFGIPFITSILQNMKYKSSKDEKLIEEIQRQYFQPTLKESLSKYKELIEQLDGKLTPFEMVEKFLQRSMFVNNQETRLNWLRKLTFLMAYCVEGAITPRMNFMTLLENLFDDEDYYSRLISFLLSIKEKAVDQSKNPYERSKTPNTNNLTTQSTFGSKKNDFNLAKQSSSCMYDLQNFSEQPLQYEYNEEIMLIIINSLYLFEILFKTNQTLVISKIYNYYLNSNCEYYKLQFACVQSIHHYCRDRKPTEVRMQVFKGFVFNLLKLCEKSDRKLIKECYLAIHYIIDSDKALLPQFELLKLDGPNILIDNLQIIDLEQIKIILNLILLLRNSLDIFIKLGLTHRIVQIIYILEEIEGLTVQESLLIKLESILLIIVRKNELSQLKTQQKKTIFNLMKSTNSNSPEHLHKVMELIQEITKKDLVSKKQLGVYIVNKILNLIYTIDKNPNYQKIYSICLEILMNYIQDNLLIKHKLQKESALKGILSAKLEKISQSEQEISGYNVETFNGQVIALCEELYDININNQDGSLDNNISPIVQTLPNHAEDLLQNAYVDDEDIESIESDNHKQDDELSDKAFSPLETEEHRMPQMMDDDKKMQLTHMALSKFYL